MRIVSIDGLTNRQAASLLIAAVLGLAGAASGQLTELPDAAEDLVAGEMGEVDKELEGLCKKYTVVTTCQKLTDENGAPVLDETGRPVDDERGCIPINLCDKQRESWKLEWDQISDEDVDKITNPTFQRRVRHLRGADRSPGPINIQRHPAGWSYQGIPTFFGLPVALTPEDLKAGEIDVAILGAPLDTSGGMRGGAFGPRAVRSSARYLPQGIAADGHLHVLVNPFETLRIVDYGDAAIDNMSADRTMEPVRKLVREIAAVELGAKGKKRRVIPFIVGGDHSLEYPNVAGLADVYGKGKIGVIHFDAHYDASKGFLGHLVSHGMPVYRMINEGHILGKNYIQVGLRGYYPGKEGLQWMVENKMRYHTAAEIERDGWDAVMKRVLQEALDGPEYLYISLDIDVLDPAFSPGTGTPEPGGLTPRELFPLVRGLCAQQNVVGFDLVEVNPLADPGYTTALNANRALRECLTGIAMNREGIKDPRFLHGLSNGDQNAR